MIPRALQAACLLLMKYLPSHALKLLEIVIMATRQGFPGGALLAENEIFFSHPENGTRWQVREPVSIPLKLIRVDLHVHESCNALNVGVFPGRATVRPASRPFALHHRCGTSGARHFRIGTRSI